METYRVLSKAPMNNVTSLGSIKGRVWMAATYSQMTMLLGFVINALGNAYNIVAGKVKGIIR